MESVTGVKSIQVMYPSPAGSDGLADARAMMGLIRNSGQDHH